MRGILPMSTAKIADRLLKRGDVKMAKCKACTNFDVELDICVCDELCRFERTTSDEVNISAMDILDLEDRYTKRGRT